MIADIIPDDWASGVGIMPMPTRTKAPRMEVLGEHRRVRVSIYEDGRARVAVRYPAMGMVTRASAWRCLGEYAIHEAHRATSILVPMVDVLCTQAGLKPPTRCEQEDGE